MVPLAVGVVDQLEVYTFTIPVLTAPEPQALSTDEQETNRVPTESPRPQKYPPKSGLRPTGAAVREKWMVGGVLESR